MSDLINMVKDSLYKCPKLPVLVTSHLLNHPIFSFNVRNILWEYCDIAWRIFTKKNFFAWQSRVKRTRWDNRASRGQIWCKFRLNSQGNCGTNRFFWLKYWSNKTSWDLITRLLRDYPQASYRLASHAVVFRGGVNTSPLKTTAWEASYGLLWGNDRRLKGGDGKAKLFERGTKCRERKETRDETKPTVSYVDAPTVIDTCGLCLGNNLSTDA